MAKWAVPPHQAAAICVLPHVIRYLITRGMSSSPQISSTAGPSRWNVLRELDWTNPQSCVSAVSMVVMRPVSGAFAVPRQSRRTQSSTPYSLTRAPAFSTAYPALHKA